MKWSNRTENPDPQVKNPPKQSFVMLPRATLLSAEP